MRADDLAPLFAAPGPGVGFRQGVVVAWDKTNAANQIAVGGAVLSNVPILNTNEASLLAPGDVVGLLTAGSSWFILGRVTVPGTPAAATALRMVSDRYIAAAIATAQTTTSTTYTDLATVGPSVDVTVSASGKCVVSVSAILNYNAAGDGTDGGAVSFAVSGATTVAAGTYQAFSVGGVIVTGVETGVFGAVATASANFLLEGLNPGAHTITLKYVSSFARSVEFRDRNLLVLAL